ncbi:MAG TPA: hypothetical protein VM243_06715 [Phycisphaerae bacterium]|nr:hypothetical protein [Phycisphaerae bacterium]
MLYATCTFWLVIAVLTAWGVHHLWSSMLKPRTVNSILLPGTLVAQLGHVLGLLVTGATVTNTTLYKDDESGEPEMTQDPKPRIPVIGPILIGMLPLLACAVAIFFVTRYLGGPFVAQMSEQNVAETLPTTLAGFWELLRDQITLVELAVAAAMGADWGRWEVWLFVYLVICLTVRMAPFPGTLRGTLGATVVLGLLAAFVASVADIGRSHFEDGWTVLSLSVATLLFLLLASLLVRGTVGLVKLLAGNK